MRTKIYSFIATVLGMTCAVALAAGVPQKFPTDTLQLGIPGAPVKSITVNTGDGVNNPAITVDGTVKEFNLNKNANLKGNTNTLGDGTTADKNITFDTGDGVNNKKITLKGVSKDVELNSNTLKVGDGAASNKILQFNKGVSSPEIRWNNANSKLEFSNDGTTYKAIGSGGGAGGGINFLQELNPGFEDGTGNWTATGLSFTTTTTASDVGFELRSGVVNSSAASQRLDSAIVSVPSGLNNSPCVAAIWYKTTETTNKYSLQVYNVTDALVVSEFVLESRSGFDRDSGYAAFSCDSSKTYRLRIVSSGDAADLFLDQMFLGEQKTFQISQATKYGSVEYAPSANCEWTTNATTSGASFPVDNDCSTPVATGRVLAPLTKIPAIRLQEPGEYLVILNTNIAQNPGNYISYYLSNGVDVTDEPTYLGNTDVGAKGTLAFNLKKTNFNLETWEVYGRTPSGILNMTMNGVSYKNTFTVYRFPTGSEQAVRADAVGKYVEAVIGGANISLSLASQATFIPQNNSGLSLTNSGSLASLIACNSGTASTGNTCVSADENNGIAFNVEEAGTWEVCSSFIHEVNDNTGQFAFRLDRTQDATDTTIEEGKKVEAKYLDRTPGNIAAALPINLCSYFDLGVGKQTFRVKYKQTVGSGIGQNSVASSSITLGLTTGGIRWTAKPINVKRNVPVVFKGMVTSPATTSERIARAQVSNSGSCAFVSQNGAFSSAVFQSTGVCRLTFVNPYTSYNCTSDFPGAGAVGTGTDSSNTGYVDLITVNSATGTPTNFNANIICVGN